MYTIFDRDPERGPATSEELFAHIHPDDSDELAPQVESLERKVNSLETRVDADTDGNN